MLAIRTILHGTDFSEPSAYAFSMACALARDYGARLVVVHVVLVPVVFAAEGMVDPYSGDWKAEAAGKLRRLEPSSPGLYLDRRLEEGDAESGILRVSEEVKADLIVIGTHGRTGLSRLLMGSVAEHVVRRAACPVVSVSRPFVAPAEVTSS